MTNSIQTTVLASIPAKSKQTQSGWYSFNAPCCHHRGHKQDRRGRGGILPTQEGALSYHCFNCGYTASWRPGWHIGFKFRKLLSWLGVDEREIQRLKLEALRIKQEFSTTLTETDLRQEKIDFEPRPLPTGSLSYHAIATFAKLGENYQFDQDLVDQVEYLYNRSVDMKEYEFYYSPMKDMKMNRRVIVPFYWESDIVGYTARAIDPGVEPKYHSNHDTNYVFNVNRQRKEWSFVIVCEGVFDAISINGVAVLSNRINETQAEIIERLGREIIVVPDFDPTGRDMLTDAIEYGWSVSFPVWAETCKDISEAVKKYGKLFVLKSILEAKETNHLKIQLLERNFFREKKNK